MTVALLALFLGSRTVNAQVLYGSVTGTVTDKTGAVVPNVPVRITDQGTGEVRTTVASERGDYALLDMLPGTFTVSVAKSGAFAGYTVKDIVVQVNRQVRVDITLQLASVSTEVTITSAPPELQTETAVVNHEISETQLDSLPVTSSQGRNFQSMYTLIPGAAAVGEQNSTASNPSRAMSANVNGTEDMGVSMRIDGAMNTYGWLPYIVAYVPPADSIENVNVATNSFNAEQGMAGGAAINVTVKTGTRNLHGSAWEYYQDAAFNARGYTVTQASLVNPLTNPTGSVPKNVFDQFGFTIGGPVYIPKILTGKKKLFFFQAFERTTRRQLLAGTLTVPDTNMIGGDFAEVANLGNSPTGFSYSSPIYDPQPLGVGPYISTPSARPTFMSEYADASGTLCPAGGCAAGTGFNGIPKSRLSPAGSTMVSYLGPIGTAIGTPSAALLDSRMANDYVGTGTLAYNRNTSDSKVTYIPTENTQIFGRYSVEPFTVLDPQQLGGAGGGTFDGGQPGQGHGMIQNVGLGASHVFTPNLVMDADFGYTRQVTGAQSALDLKDGNFGLDVLKIPGTNSASGGVDYQGQPEFVFSQGFGSLGNSNGANPFLFRDNQFTGDVNLSWTKGKHSTKYGFTWYHFDLNHFQPTSGGGVSSPRGGFQFQGAMTDGPLDLDPVKGTANTPNAYTALADLLLGLPNNAGISVAKETQSTDPNSLRWSTYAAYAQDQWTISPKLTLNYGVRYELYPMLTRDHAGVGILYPNLPITANVEMGGIGGNPKNAGVNMEMAFKGFAPRLGVAYRLNEKTVIRAGGGLTSDPDSDRFMRDSFPEDISPTYSGTSANPIAVDGVSGNQMTLAFGIPAPVFPTINSSGFAGLPVSGSTNTMPKNYHRGYIESWNLFIQRDLGHDLIANVGYVGTHQVRQIDGVSINAAPLPSASTPCMANGQYNPSSGLSGPCSANANMAINQTMCAGTANLICYNTGGITINEPIFSSNYNGMQSQLTRNAGKNSSFGLVYTWSHAFDYEDNGAGSGSAGNTQAYPAYFKLDHASAGYDRKQNLQFWGIYHLPFGHGQRFANQGILSEIIGGWQLNGQFSHISGAPFSVSPASNTLNTPYASLFAEQTGPYKQIGGHERKPGDTNVSGGKAWFDTSVFSNPTEPAFCSVYDAKKCPVPNTGIVAPTFSNITRNAFRGPGQSVVNASIFKAFHLYRESEFQVRMEGFNIFNHPLLNNPNATVGGGTFGYITSFGNTRTVQFSGRYSF
jgi:hypothetical protein